MWYVKLTIFCLSVSYGTISRYYYATRTRSDLHIFVPNSSFGKRRIKYKCSVLWNSLPDHVKVCSTLKVFKKNIKNHLNLLCISD